MIRNCLLSLITFLLLISHLDAQQILMFVSHEDTYYSEYIVMKEALEASGYSVDVRSATNQNASVYMIPNGTTIEATANTLSNSSYSDFTLQFQSLFGLPWNEGLDAIPGEIIVYGSILDIPDMAAYDGLVVAGGTGALDYRIDGAYQAQGEGERLVGAEDIAAVAQKLNDLAIETVMNGKPLMAQCHGASLPLFWRIPGTLGQGVDGLGISLLEGGIATGFPEPETQPTIESLGATFRSNDRVTVSSPSEHLLDEGAGDFKILTTKDWYPQTVAHAARTFLNILQSYPSVSQQQTEKSVLILHGGAVDETDCAASNRENDIPCNHGSAPEDLPADWMNVHNLLTADSDADAFSFIVDEIDLSDPALLPFDPSVQASVLATLEGFDVVIFYKHWSTGLTTPMLQAITTFADNGGGVIALHHGLYNDQDGLQNKDILVSLFEAQSASPPGWSSSLQSYDLFSTNYGHFISTYGVTYDDALTDPTEWSTTPLLSPANTPYSTLPSLQIFDEIYNNTSFEPGVIFGRNVNQVSPLFSNNASPSGQEHTAAFSKIYDGNGDGITGKLFYIQAGERVENYQAGVPYFQIVRNAVAWAAPATEPMAQTIDFPVFSEYTYGDDEVVLPEFASSGLPIFYESSEPTVAEVAGNVLIIVGAGSATITASQAGNSDFSPAISIDRDLLVFPATFSINIDDKQRIYGSENPQLTGQVSGVVNDDDITVQFYTDATFESNVGSYIIDYTVTDMGNRLGNYDVTAELGELTIIQATQDISFDPIPTIDLESSNIYVFTVEVNTGLPLTFEITEGAAITSISGQELTFSGTGTVTVEVSQAGNMNFEPASAEQTFNVISTALQDQQITFSEITEAEFGDVVLLDAFSDSELLVDFVIVEGVGTILDSELTIQGAGNFVIEATQAGNETFNPAEPAEQSFLASKATLQVLAQDVSIEEGEEVPVLPISYSGFKFDDGPEALDVQPTVDTEATALSAPGTYDIIISGGQDDNYLFSYENGELTIIAEPLAIDSKRVLFYPNPVSDRVIFSGESSYDVQVVSSAGKRVLEQFDVQEINVSTLPKGIYLMLMIEENGKTSQTKLYKK